VLIAPSGSFLELCDAYAGEVLDRLRAGMSEGRIAVAGTYMYETDPLSISFGDLRAQVALTFILRRGYWG